MLVGQRSHCSVALALPGPMPLLDAGARGIGLRHS
jgi:hypothetical protein